MFKTINQNEYTEIFKAFRRCYRGVKGFGKHNWSVAIHKSETVDGLRGGWSGGSRDHYEYFAWRDGNVIAGHSVAVPSDPFNSDYRSGARAELTDETGVIQFIVFCGKTLGPRIHVSPNLAKTMGVDDE